MSQACYVFRDNNIITGKFSQCICAVQEKKYSVGNIYSDRKCADWDKYMREQTETKESRDDTQYGGVSGSITTHNTRPTCIYIYRTVVNVPACVNFSALRACVLLSQ